MYLRSPFMRAVTFTLSVLTLVGGLAVSRQINADEVNCPGSPYNCVLESSRYANWCRDLPGDCDGAYPNMYDNFKYIKIAHLKTCTHTETGAVVQCVNCPTPVTVGSCCYAPTGQPSCPTAIAFGTWGDGVY
jgi:hypothetical protein